MHIDACAPGARVWLVDDLLATGGTALPPPASFAAPERASPACRSCCRPAGLGGAERLRAEGYEVHALVEFEGTEPFLSLA